MVELLETYSIHLFSILLLLIIYILNKLKKDTKTFSMKLFYNILFTNILLLILEPLSFLADETGVIFVHYLNYSLDFYFFHHYIFYDDYRVLGFIYRL